jgi:hypothetical protein
MARKRHVEKNEQRSRKKQKVKIAAYENSGLKKPNSGPKKFLRSIIERKHGKLVKKQKSEIVAQKFSGPKKSISGPKK